MTVVWHAIDDRRAGSDENPPVSAVAPAVSNRMAVLLELEAAARRVHDRIAALLSRESGF